MVFEAYPIIWVLMNRIINDKLILAAYHNIISREYFFILHHHCSSFSICFAVTTTIATNILLPFIFIDLAFLLLYFLLKACGFTLFPFFCSLLNNFLQLVYLFFDAIVIYNYLRCPCF